MAVAAAEWLSATVGRCFSKKPLGLPPNCETKKLQFRAPEVVLQIVPGLYNFFRFFFVFCFANSMESSFCLVLDFAGFSFVFGVFSTTSSFSSGLKPFSDSESLIRAMWEASATDNGRGGKAHWIRCGFQVSAHPA